MSTEVNPTIVLDMIESFRRSQALFAGCELRIFDHLEQQPATLAQLAKTISADLTNLERLLDALVGLGLLTKSEGRSRAHV